MLPTTILLLGSFDLHPAGPIRLSRKTAALLAWLAVERRPHERRRLQSLFLAEADDPQRALRWHLSQMRRALGPECLLTSGERVSLAEDRVTTDVKAFEAALSGSLEGQPEASLAAAVGLYRDEFLAGLTLDDAPEFDLWLLGERARWRQRYEHGLEALGTRRLAAGDLEAALSYTRRLAASNPLLEPAQLRLMALYAATGQRAAALEVFDTLVQLLRRELGVEPTAPVLDLHARIRSGQAIALQTPLPAPLRQGASQPKTTRFAGRQPELARLREVWGRAVTGTGGVVWIEAEAGGGKTRLIDEASTRFDPPPLLLIGHGYESTRTQPLWPWVEVISSRLALVSDAALRDWPSYWIDPVLRLLPEAAPRFQRPTPDQTRSLDWAEHLRALAECVTAAALTQPLLIVLEDAQWLDTLSLQLFHAVARLAPRRRLLLVGLLRTGETEPSEALRALCDDLDRMGALRFVLPPLTADAVAILAEARWPAWPASDRSEFIARLARAAGGNPLFVNELLTALPTPADWPERLPLSLTLTDVLARRLQPMTESGRQVLEALAVIGEPATLAALEQVSGRSEAEVIAGLDTGLRLKLLVELQPDSPARYDFVHDLFREAALAPLTDVRRRLLHRRATDLLVRAAGRHPPGERGPLAGSVLRHARAGEADRQVSIWAPIAATHALRLGAYPEALDAWAAAAASAARQGAVGELGRVEAERRQLEAVLGRCEALEGLGQSTEVELKTAADLITRQRDPLWHAYYHLHHAIALSHTSYGDAYQVARRAEGYARRAEDIALVAECLVYAGRMQLSLAETASGIALIEEALALYHRIPDLERVGSCLATLAWALLDSGRLSAALRQLDEAESLVQASGDPLRRALHALVRAIAWSYVYDSARVRVAADEALRICLTIGREAGVPRARFYLAVSAWLAADWAQARATGEQVWHEAQAIADAWQAAWAAHLTGRCALQAGDPEDAERWLTRAAEMRRAQGEAQNLVSDLAWLARLRLVQGRAAEALTFSHDAVERLAALPAGTWVWEQQDVFMVHAETLAATGAPVESAAMVRRARETLRGLLAGVDDPALREQVLAAPANVRIEAAFRALPLD